MIDSDVKRRADLLGAAYDKNQEQQIMNGILNSQLLPPPKTDDPNQSLIEYFEKEKREKQQRMGERKRNIGLSAAIAIIFITLVSIFGGAQQRKNDIDGVMAEARAKG